MSIFRSRANASVAVPQYTGLQIQTSSSALPIPIAYGTSRLAPNLIWADNFQTQPQYSQQGGKGGGQKTAVSGYSYSTALILAVCEGPIHGLGTVFRGQGKHSLADYAFSVFTGTTPQAPWGYLTSTYPGVALGYQGTAFAASSVFDLGGSASINSIAFEVSGRLFPTNGVNSYDADPALVIGDFLTNAQYGLGFPAASLDATSLYGASGDGSYQTYCQALGLVFSPCLSDQEAANATLARWLRVTNAAAVWSGGRLKIIPFGDTPVTGHLANGSSVTFQPNTTPIYDLGDDDFVYDGEGDPLTVARIDPYAASNVLRLEILDRANQYSATPIEARDQNAIELYGLRLASTVTTHEICDAGVASIAAQLILQRGLYVRNTYTFRLSWDYCLLEPMDLVTLTDPGLGLAKTPVRIIEIEEDASGLLSVTAEEYPGAIATALAYPVAGAVNTPINRNVTVAAVNPPIIFEPPSDLTGDVAQIWFGLSGGTSGVADPNWGGAVIYVSTDNSTYTQVGSVSASARQGVLAAALATPSASATTTVVVNLSQSGGAIDATGISATNPTLCLVGAEIIGFGSASLAGSNVYTLGSLQRAFYGQQGGAHAIGTPVLLLDGAVFHYMVPPAYIGQTVLLKFASFNIFGGAAQDLSTCVAYSITPVGSGLFGPIAQAITQGTSLDEGLVGQAISEIDSYGLASDPYTELVDMGLASDGASMLAVASGGTGATSPSAARSNIGAAASGANTDITSLNNLTALGINTTADTTNRLSVKSAASLFDNGGGGVQIAVNKASATDSATVLFQTGYSGRAQAGLLGGERYKISVSTTGSSWAPAMDVDPATGHVGLAGYSADANNALGVNGTSILFNASSDSCRMTINKAASANDATLTFETGFSARALLGLLASDSFQLKVSADGGTYRTAFQADPATGNVAMAALLVGSAYTVALLPTGVVGAIAFASNGRKIGESSGSGTGVLVTYSAGAWRRLSDDAIVST